MTETYDRENIEQLKVHYSDKVIRRKWDKESIKNDEVTELKKQLQFLSELFLQLAFHDNRGDMHLSLDSEYFNQMYLMLKGWEKKFSSDTE